MDCPSAAPVSPLLRNRVVLGWYATTLFAAAALLFWVEPMYGRLLVPRLGGAAAVWGTCMVFFQVCLLGGYAYAHALGNLLPRKAQVFVHLALVAACFCVLPLSPPGEAPPESTLFPFGWLLSELTRRIGLPFCAVAATTPLLSRWFSQTRHPSASDPYFLYAASNAGSLATLLAYPTLIEPMSRLSHQTSLWSWAFALAAGLVLGCGVWFAFVADASDSESQAAVPRAPDTTRPRSREYVLWLALAFVPSSLMLGATAFATTDVAPVPLLWVIPLAIYLLTYILAFARSPLVPHETTMRALPLVIALMAFVSLLGLARPFWLVLPLHFGSLFVVALACHGELARRRPNPRYLTAFYLITSAGGALGGLFNGLLAPVLFPTVVEYPLALVLAAALRAFTIEAPPQALDWEALAASESDSEPARPSRLRVVAREVKTPLALGAVAAFGVWIGRKLDPSWSLLLMSQVATAVCAVAYAVRRRPVRFAACAAALLFAPLAAARAQHIVFMGRSFFGVHRIEFDGSAQRNLYIQGTTIHGLQSIAPERRRVAGAYFHRTGPAGDVLSRMAPPTVALIGLGVGSLASYADSGQSFTFFEIDPMVARIAETPAYFSFLADARRRGAGMQIVLGDGRRALERSADASYDMVVLDAYSSDVIPVHLLTREAIALYLRKLSPQGLLLMNISNRYLDIGMVVSALASDASLVGRERLDTLSSDEDRTAERLDGKAVSRWIVLARRADQLEPLHLGPAWKDLPRGSMTVWTDDYVNVLSCLRW
jgi:hypothetical protein